MAVLVTVHGTFNSGDESGDSWWQIGSEFEADVKKYVESEDGQFDFYPFKWSGLNSSKARMEASIELRDLFKKIKRRREKCVIISHSHGGNIVKNSFGGFLRFKTFVKRSIWISTGAPFYSEAINFFGTPRYILIIIVATLFFVYDKNREYTVADLVKLENVEPFALVLFVALCFYFLGRVAGVRMDRAVHNAYGARLITLYHKYDEAISALKANHQFSVDLVKGNAFVESAWYYSLFAIASYFVIYPIEIDLTVSTFKIACLLLLFIGSVVGLAILLAKVLNVVAVAAVKGWAFGADRPGDVIKNISPILSDVECVDAVVVGLPSELADSLQKVSDDALSMAAPKLRRSLSGVFSYYVNQQGMSRDSAIFESANWDALIHTSYFRSASFRKFVCYNITCSEGFRATDALLSDPEYGKLVEWRREILSNPTGISAEMPHERMGMAFVRRLRSAADSIEKR